MKVCSGGTSWTHFKQHYCNNFVKVIATFITRMILKILFLPLTRSLYERHKAKHSHNFLYQKVNFSWAAGLFFFLRVETCMINPVSLLSLFAKKFTGKFLAHLYEYTALISCIKLSSCFPTLILCSIKSSIQFPLLVLIYLLYHIT